jgi:hypothetical protein
VMEGSRTALEVWMMLEYVDILIFG